jgi:hypothetical protein
MRIIGTDIKRIRVLHAEMHGMSEYLQIGELVGSVPELRIVGKSGVSGTLKFCEQSLLIDPASIRIFLIINNHRFKRVFIFELSI